jgi:hypothetical protein
MPVSYTQEEVDNIRTEERFVAYLVLSSANIRFVNMPVQYKEARNKVADIVKSSSKYDDITKERFSSYLVMVDNCVPFGERPENLKESYNKVIADVLAPSKKKDDSDIG